MEKLKRKKEEEFLALEKKGEKGPLTLVNKRILRSKGQFCEECTEVNGWPICRRRIEDRRDQSRARYYLEKISSKKIKQVALPNGVMV